jgi:hypothetical protein
LPEVKLVPLVAVDPIGNFIGPHQLDIIDPLGEDLPNLAGYQIGGRGGTGGRRSSHADDRDSLGGKSIVGRRDLVPF